jgi:hypothetical protein
MTSRMRHHHTVLLTAFALVLGCSRDEAEEPHGSVTAAPGVETPVASASRPRRSPLSLAVKGPSRVTAPSEIELTIVLHRLWDTPDPVVLTVDLPPGARLISGATSETLAPSSQPRARSLRIELERVPSADLVVRADLGGRGYGAHSRAVYRFGRPEPKPANPAGSVVVIGGRPVGKVIPLSPPASGSSP